MLFYNWYLGVKKKIEATFTKQDLGTLVGFELKMSDEHSCPFCMSATPQRDYLSHAHKSTSADVLLH